MTTPASGVVDLVVAAIGAVGAFTVVFAHRDQLIGGLALGAVILVSAWLAAIDFREHRLPNRIVGPLAAAVVIGLLVAGLVEDDLGRSGRALWLGVATAAILLGANLVGGLGMGDVKYGFPMAATLGWYGWDTLFIGLLVTTIGGAVAAVVLLIQRRQREQELAYGPYMALGLTVGLIVACW